MKRLALLAIFAGYALSGCGGGSGDGNFRTDANGLHDMGEEEVLATLLAIGQECAAQSPSPANSPSNEAECRATCDCTASAIAKLEQAADAPSVRNGCYNACSPDFVPTDDDPVFADDGDDLPDYEEFYYDYVLACDELAHQMVYNEGDFVDECVQTCNCIADHMENTISETEDDNIRSMCNSNCEAAAPKLAGPAMLKFWARGGM